MKGIVFIVTEPPNNKKFIYKSYHKNGIIN